tara:strand:+ start:52 stop:561 length:510 start_codon:yes stop_codon:yes gene_type:complete
MSDHNILAFSDYREAERKFDYFVTGVSGALFAYLGPLYKPQRIELSPLSLEPLSLIFFAMAFYFGMKRIQSVVDVGAENHSLLDHQERSKKATDALKSDAFEFTTDAGQLVPREQLVLERNESNRLTAETRNNIHKLAEKSYRYYCRRNIFLYSGFASVLLHKLLIPYV